MHKYLLAFLVIFCLFATIAGAQQKMKVDSMRLQFKNDSAYIYRPKKIMVLLSLDQRNTFLETNASVNTPIKIRGLKTGLTVYKRHITGIGLYHVRNSRTRVTYVNGTKVDIDFSFNYLTMFYEYYFIHTRTWDIGVPFEIGMGQYKTFAATADKEGTVFPMGTAIDVHLKPMRWFAINGMGGYRVVGNNNSAVKLNNWFYSVGVSLNTRNLYDDARFYIKKRQFKKEAEKYRPVRKVK